MTIIVLYVKTPHYSKSVYLFGQTVYEDWLGSSSLDILHGAFMTIRAPNCLYCLWEAAFE